MKTLLNSLNENLVFRQATAPKFYKDRADLLVPASQVFDKRMMDLAKERISSDSLNPKGAKYFMVDKNKSFSLLVTESEGKRYSVTFSGHASNDIFVPMPDFAHVIDYIRSMNIDVNLFKSSKL